MDIRNAKERLRAAGGGYVIVHESRGLELGVYVLVSPEPDRQQPHADDEVYGVLEGSGTLDVEGERVELREGQATFVPAGAEHRFVGFEQLAVLRDLRTRFALAPRETRTQIRGGTDERRPGGSDDRGMEPCPLQYVASRVGSCPDESCPLRLADDTAFGGHCVFDELRVPDRATFESWLDRLRTELDGARTDEERDELRRLFYRLLNERRY